MIALGIAEVMAAGAGLVVCATLPQNVAIDIISGLLGYLVGQGLALLVVGIWHRLSD